MAVFADTRAKSSKKIKKSKEMTKEELNSLRVRYAPTMLYPPARAAFERAINMAAQPAAERPLTGGELAALAPLESGQLSPEGISSRAATAYAVLRKAVQPAFGKKPAQAPVTPRKAFKGTEYPTAPDKGGRGAAESGKQTK